MDRRSLMAGIAGFALAQIACDSEPKPSATATLTNNEDVHKAITDLESAVEELQNNVGDFDASDWRSVVPEVKAAADSVESALAEVKRSLGYS